MRQATSAPHDDEMNPTHAAGPRWAAALIAVALATAIGLVGMPVAFFVAYAFRDQVTAEMHGFFLLEVVVLVVVSTLVAWPLLASTLRYGAARGLAGALAVVGATYAAALGLGTIVTLLHEGAGSVSADQPDWPFLALVAGCALVVAAGGSAARQALRPELPALGPALVGGEDGARR
jgi:hypothetical protein